MIEPTMPVVLLPANMRIPCSPRNLSYEGNSHQYSVDLVNPPVAPMTLRWQSLTSIITTTSL